MRLDRPCCLLLSLSLTWCLGDPAARSQTTLASPASPLGAQTGHADAVAAVAVSPCGQILASIDWRGGLVLWDLITYDQIWTFDTGLDCPLSLRFLPGSRHIAIEDMDGVPYLLDVTTAELRLLVEGGDDEEDWTHRTAWAEHNAVVAIQDTPTSLQVDHLYDGWAPTRLPGEPGVPHSDPAVAEVPIRIFALSPEGRLLVVGTDEGWFLQDTRTARVVQARRSPRTNLSGVAFSPHGDRIAIGNGIYLTVVNTLGGDVVWQAQPWSHRATELSIDWSDDGSYLLVHDGGKSVAVLDADLGTVVWTYSARRSLHRARFTPYDEYAVLSRGPGDNTKALEFHDWRTGELVDTVGLRGSQRHTAMTPAGDLVHARHRGIVVCAGIDCAVPDELEGMGIPVRDLALSDRYLLIAGEAATLWDLQTGAEIHRLREAEGDTTHVGLSSDGSTAILSGPGHSAWVWDIAEQRETKRFEAEYFSPDLAVPGDRGRLLITTDSRNSNRATLWDTEADGETPILHLDSSLVTTEEGTLLNNVTAAAVAPREKALAFGYSGGTCAVHDARTLERQWTVTAHTDVIGAVDFCPDGRWLATGGWDGEIHRYAASSGALLESFAGHDAPISVLQVSPDGRWVISGAWDRSARLWRVSRTAEPKLLDGHVGRITAAAFTADSRIVLTGSEDGTVRLWRVRDGQQIGALMALRDGGWVVLDPDGNYDSSGGGAYALYSTGSPGGVPLGGAGEHVPGLLHQILENGKEQ